jgi:hypothetical protein
MGGHAVAPATSMTNSRRLSRFQTFRQFWPFTYARGRAHLANSLARGVSMLALFGPTAVDSRESASAVAQSQCRRSDPL